MPVQALAARVGVGVGCWLASATRVALGTPRESRWQLTTANPCSQRATQHTALSAPLRAFFSCPAANRPGPL